jgi:hypothetical protein
MDVLSEGLPCCDESEDIRVCTMPWSEFAAAMVAERLDMPDTGDLATLMRLQLFASRSTDPRHQEVEDLV